MLKMIGIVNSPYKEKFCIPRQPRIARSIVGVIKIIPPYNHREAFLGLEEFDYIWISFLFHKSKSKENQLSIRPPRLGGNRKMGVFATRSPFRPNNMGLSAVKLLRIEYKKSEVLLHISGHDFLDGTPVYDIRPYLPESDCIMEAGSGWTEDVPFQKLNEEINFSKQALTFMNDNNLPELKKEIEELLIFDPRPAYRCGRHGEYAVKFKNLDIHFEISESNHVVISEIESLKENKV